ncbi:MAG: hypothetical protein J6C63_02570 [Lachnospiraceae bacterium]|nr:hypothetical protein [Lachnospiraceae bacterium]
MQKFIEIPIYALDERTLCVRYEKYVEELRRDVFSDINEETFKRCLEIGTYPKRVWEYNHIVGYIVIGYEFGDLQFKVYLPTSQKQRYRWRTTKKTFLYDTHSNGTHFRVDGSMSSQDIQQEIENMLNSIIKEHVPKRYYVDRQAFDNINSKIDYLKIINEVANK